MPRSRQELVDALRQVSLGDRAALELLYQATSAKLYGIVLRIVGHRDLVDDLLQDIYLRVCQRAAEFDPRQGSPITWLATIARNRSLDDVRRVELPIAHDFSEALGVANADSPLSALARKEDATRLLACLEAMGAERRDIVLKAYVFGMSRRQIAHTVGRPLATLKTWLRRALSELRVALEDTEPLPQNAQAPPRRRSRHRAAVGLPPCLPSIDLCKRTRAALPVR